MAVGEIDNWRIEEFKVGVEHFTQQEGSRLRSQVRNESQVGKASFYDQLAPTEVNERTVRHGDSPFNQMEHDRRQNIMRDYDWGTFVDVQDLLRTINDPRGPYTEAAGMSFGRNTDQILVDAMFGTTNSGEHGEDPVAWDDVARATNPDYLRYRVPCDLTTKTADERLTLAKMVKAKTMLDRHEAPSMGRTFVYTGNQLEDVLNDETITSIDYASVKRLVDGENDSFLGFKFVRLNEDLLPFQTGAYGQDDDQTPTTGIRRCFAFQQSGLLLGVGIDTEANYARRADKGFSWYLHMIRTEGGSRQQETKCVEIECAE